MVDIHIATSLPNLAATIVIYAINIHCVTNTAGSIHWAKPRAVHSRKYPGC